MEQWLKIGRHQVNEFLDRDREFQALLAQMHRAEEEYRLVREKLSPEDREIVERYISLCEDVEYYKTHTAYKCGKMTAK